jgi:DNA-binding transcriptional ArsR family regulator
MVNFPASRGGSAGLDRVFSALADPTRRRILTRLVKGPATITDLAAPFRVSLPAVSKHIKVLERAGLLAREVEGRVHRCSLTNAGLRNASVWIDAHRQFWNTQFDALERFVTRPEARDTRALRTDRGKKRT